MSSAEKVESQGSDPPPAATTPPSAAAVATPTPEEPKILPVPVTAPVTAKEGDKGSSSGNETSQKEAGSQVDSKSVVGGAADPTKNMTTVQKDAGELSEQSKSEPTPPPRQKSPQKATVKENSPKLEPAPAATGPTVAQNEAKTEPEESQKDRESPEKKPLSEAPSNVTNADGQNVPKTGKTPSDDGGGTSNDKNDQPVSTPASGESKEGGEQKKPELDDPENNKKEPKADPVPPEVKDPVNPVVVNKDDRIKELEKSLAELQLKCRTVNAELSESRASVDILVYENSQLHQENEALLKAVNSFKLLETQLQQQKQSRPAENKAKVANLNKFLNMGGISLNDDLSVASSKSKNDEPDGPPPPSKPTPEIEVEEPSIVPIKSYLTTDKEVEPSSENVDGGVGKSESVAKNDDQANQSQGEEGQQQEILGLRREVAEFRDNYGKILDSFKILKSACDAAVQELEGWRKMKKF